MRRILVNIAMSAAAVLFFLVSCETETTAPSVPVLLSDRTLGPVTEPPTAARLSSPTPTVSVRLSAAPPPTAPHSLWNLPDWWRDAKTPGMLTATLLPTRTPFATDTPTLTRTPTHTPTPTASRTPTRTASPSPHANPPDTLTPEGCAYRWFFENAPQTCPADEALTQPGIFLAFERGAMIWLGTEKSILILFSNADSPRWLLLPDPYQAGMADTDPAVVPPGGFFQPKRGFGLLWRGNPGIRDRLGWAIALEMSYNAVVQTDALTGVQYVRGPGREIYVLSPGQVEWTITQ